MSDDIATAADNEKKIEAEIRKIDAEIENMNCTRRLEGLKIFLLAVGALGALISYLMSHATEIQAMPPKAFNYLVLLFGIVVFGIYILTAYVSEGHTDKHITAVNFGRFFSTIIILIVIFALLGALYWIMIAN
ncbi:hypothetical protein [Gluconobacter cerinus]|uniref:hypothetical protein n=1 Tax=Gluconobacter cerinus TaxID=38307 RepID=UPI001B8C407E|nr:hypothetical protein [Gluconobacter cerinus]MBS0983383.1 hypothetical protein [Gluconobacter cerinus]